MEELSISHRSTGRHELVPAALMCPRDGRASEMLNNFPLHIDSVSVVSEVTRGDISDFGVLRMMYYQ
jgi:hypothetical protein